MHYILISYIAFIPINEILHLNFKPIYKYYFVRIGGYANDIRNIIIKILLAFFDFYESFDVGNRYNTTIK